MDVYITGLAPLAGLRGIFLRGRGGCRRTIKFLRRSRSCLHLGIVLIRYTQAAVSIYVLCVCACVCVCEGCAYAWSPSSSLGSRLHTQHTHTQTHTHVRAREHTHTHNIYILVCMYVCMYVYIYHAIYKYKPVRLPFWRQRGSLPPWQTQKGRASCRLLPRLPEWRIGGAQVVLLLFVFSQGHLGFSLGKFGARRVSVR